MHNHKNKLTSEVNTRRTFAIISHPDAGKTTLTEKLLLFGGAIRLAGTVKGRKSGKHATSDWMKIEQQRGISVTSSVMQFSYQGLKINILDTPGHQDFSEDTYRTLNAADSAVMLIDAAKGVEAQTIKLFEVCRIRSIPIFTFINKMDRHGKDPLELLEEIEQVLGVRSCPMNWPIGMGRDFRGIFDRQKNRLELFNERSVRKFVPCAAGIEDPALKNVIDETLYHQLYEHISLLDIAGDPFDRQQIQKGQLTPVFFGSAITNFGVQTFLDDFLELAPAPTPRKSSIGLVAPEETPFSGFVFKIQANMNPAHRDRIAFLRICSGKFSRGIMANHVRTGKKIRLSQPQQFLAQGRNIIDEAYPGDIIGIFDPGIFQIGDTLCEEGSFQYERLPRFSPEHFARVTVKDAMKHKQFQKGINQLAEEGAVQIFRTFRDRTEDIILGVVGKLQFEVFEYRLKAEYGADILLQHLRFNIARWVKSDNPEDIRQLHSSSSPCVKDHNGDTVVLYENDFALRWAAEKNPRVRFCKPYELSDG
ncbi:peptide chain release factor 3 [Phosphitispora fastidiosa]|uniref:peptide chain release factor 3 n=1 Tax=Phosphitispora fastidiosa TaxID=2837202 RepID=UPI001E49DDEE|nr:peptide chain release factor 3 [Phosphitispora fastidiosa]MBU7008055.1 peptide chain release factor 3 [Phosphitispora fastidiosa]